MSLEGLRSPQVVQVLLATTAPGLGVLPPEDVCTVLFLVRLPRPAQAPSRGREGRNAQALGVEPWLPSGLQKAPAWRLPPPHALAEPTRAPEAGPAAPVGSGCPLSHSGLHRRPGGGPASGYGRAKCLAGV